MRPDGGRDAASVPAARDAEEQPPAWLAELVPAGLDLVLFAGKGGTGKTTCAAAIALLLAAHRDRPVSLLSTDPAHSLGDVLGIEADDRPRQVAGGPPGLRVRELDADAAWEGWRESYRETVAELFDRLTGGGGLEAPLDRAVIERLLEVPPPGLDELIAVTSLTDALQEAEEPPLLVVDTAPTGHALRLLEMPDVALAWDHELLAILLEYREALGLGPLARQLLELARSLKRVRGLLRDPERCRLVPVTRPSRMAGLETRRLLEALGDLEVPVRSLVVNAVQKRPGADACAHCRARAELHAREIATLRAEIDAERRGRCGILVAPARYPPPSGPGPLARWARCWALDRR